MEKQTVLIGSIAGGSGGITQDDTREVKFMAEELGCYREYGTGRGGGPTDTRGVTETLYKTEDGRLVVHVKDWSHWQGEPNTYTLHHVTEEDLQPGGRFEALGAECGFGRPLTLDEALTPREDEGAGD